ncbi:putative S-layer protein [Candidatus Woesearchaeota archaeon]|nr:putative S-layer protein [Candidatus Woesearchaeota archaeon]
MYKKLSFLGIILALLLLTVNSAFALQEASVNQPAAGNPEATVTGNFMVNDNVAGNAVTNIGFTSATLTSGSNSIANTAVSFNPTTIANLNDGATSSAVVVSVAIPANQAAGTYTGLITISGTENAATVTDTFTLSVVVNSVIALNVLTYDNTTSLEIIGEESQTGITGTFQMKNTGNQPITLTTASFDTAALDLTDNDNDAITLSFSDPGTINAGETKAITITSAFGDNIDLDTYGGVINVKSGSTILDSFKLDLKVHPEICEDGIVKDGDASSRSAAHLQLNIKDPDNGDDFKSGDQMNIEVEVQNEDDENLDVTVEAILYNLDEDEEVATAESSSEEIKDNDEETFEFDLEVPRNFDGDEDDRYVLFIKTLEDGDEDQNCNFDSINMDFDRDKDDIIVRSADLTTSIVKPGDIVELIVDVENVGSNDQRDAYVKVSNNELGINLVSAEFDLDKSGDSNDDITRRFTLNIPANADEKDYLIDISVYDDNDDAYDNSQEFVTLTVKSTGTTITGTGKQVDLNVATQTKEFDAAKGTANLHLQFTNNEDRDVNTVIDVSTIGDWADPISSQTVSLHPGDNNLYFNLKLKDIDEGTYTATVTVRPATGNEFDTKSFSLNFDVKGKAGVEGITGAFAGANSSTMFWIIGDILLIVVALFFVKMIFFGKK